MRTHHLHPFNHFFRLRFITDPEGGGGGSSTSSEELGFPADTEPEDMDEEQQLAFYKHESAKWKGLSRKHEKNRKPKEFDADMAELAQLREKQGENLEPDAKAAAAATKAAIAAAEAKGVERLLKPAVREAFRARAPHLSEDELDEFLEDIDVSADRFLSDDGLDVERIDRLAKRIAKPAEIEDGANKTPRFNLGDVTQRDSRKQKKVAGDSRQEAYDRTRARFTKKSTDSK